MGVSGLPKDGTGEPERHDEGFAVVEMLVAFAILATALAVLLAVLSDGIRRHERAEQLTVARLAAQSLLARVGVDIPLTTGVTNGSLSNGMRWQLSIERYGDPADLKAWPTAAYRVALQVSTQNADEGSPLIELATLRLGGTEARR